MAIAVRPERAGCVTGLVRFALFLWAACSRAASLKRWRRAVENSVSKIPIKPGVEISTVLAVAEDTFRRDLRPAERAAGRLFLCAGYPITSVYSTQLASTTT
jgi:hypothetical protein